MLLVDRFAVSSGYRVRRPNGTRNWLITYTLAGMGRYGYPDGELFCCAGDIVLLAPNTPHDYATASHDEAWHFYWAHFTPRPTWGSWLQLPSVASGLLAFAMGETSARERIERAFERMLVDSHSLHPLHEDLAMNALEELVLVASATHLRGSATRHDPRVEAVLARLSTNLDRLMSVDELANAVALSPSRLAHLFKLQVGASIQQVHMQLRLRQAARLLGHTTHSIGAIADSLGFRSPFHFSQRFKAYYGVSPAAYRSQQVRFQA
jgi:AraC family transcriptional regulator of arabinose operon